MEPIESLRAALLRTTAFTHPASIVPPERTVPGPDAETSEDSGPGALAVLMPLADARK